MGLIMILCLLITIGIIQVFYRISGKFNVMNLAIELHFAAITLILPLPAIRPDLIEILTNTSSLIIMSLIITCGLYMKTELNPRLSRYKIIGLLLSLSLLGFGITLSYILS